MSELYSEKLAEFYDGIAKAIGEYLDKRDKEQEEPE